MAIPILIMGRSGSGKSASMKNLQKAFIINVNSKPLPFRVSENSDIKVYKTDDYLRIKNALSKSYESGYKTAIIDDCGYMLTAKFMAGHRQAKGNSQFDLYNEIGDNFWSLMRFIADDLPNDMTVYVVMHEDKNDFGESKPKTIGKLLDDKVCVEGMFTIVFHAMKLDGKYVFATNTDGLDVTKTPIGMFEETYVDNDLDKIDKTIREYYDIILK